MIDPLLSLSIAIHAQKGVYALLLGSGLSRAAEVPTGWEIVVDLIRTLARLKQDNSGEDPANWFRRTFGAPATYDGLLASLAGTPAERRQLLAKYFEPTLEERERGSKSPTAAHRAIAELVTLGYIRLILTTNFDRLIEQALEAAGVVPTVLSTTDAVQGALPLAHQTCCVVKLHGDYLDTRLKNTADELAAYDNPVQQLLERVFDEYGLVISGWSGEWDSALRAALERCASHRFTTYWTTRGELRPAAQGLATLRRAEIIRIHDADDFFGKLLQNVRGLADVTASRHPLSAKIAVASVKRYAADVNRRIELHDLVVGEAERLATQLTGATFSFYGDDDEFKRQVRTYETLSELLVAIFAQGCHWTGREHDRLWTESLSRIANARREESGTSDLVYLRLYPALMLLYAGGVASVAAERYDRLASLLTKATVRIGWKDKPLITAVNCCVVMSRGGKGIWPQFERYPLPISMQLHHQLREPVKDLAPDDAMYDSAFDEFEYLAALVHADLEDAEQERDSVSEFMTVGRFAWNANREALIAKIDRDARSAGNAWGPVQARLFGASTDRFFRIKKRLDEFIRKLG